MRLLILSAEDVAAVTSSLSPDTLMSLMADVFVRAHKRDRVALPHRTSITTNAHTTLFMPAHLDDYGTSIKIVSVPGPDGGGGVHATTIVLDEKSGAVKAIINADSLTALRTAAGSALATRLLAPPNPRILVAFGVGRQIEAHIDLLIRTIPSLNSCIIVNRSFNARLENLHSNLQTRFTRIKFISESTNDPQNPSEFNLEHVISSADIICAATSSKRPLFSSSWVKKGAHIILVGSYTPEMAEVDDELIRRAGRILVDSRDACCAEAGELIRAKVEPKDLIEVGELLELDGKSIPDAIDGVKRAGDVTIFKSVGIGLQDTAIANVIFENAVSAGLGTWITA